MVGPLGGLNGCRDSVKGKEKDTRGRNEGIFVPPFVKGLTINRCAVSWDDSTTERVTDKLQIQTKNIKQPDMLFMLIRANVA